MGSIKEQFPGLYSWLELNSFSSIIKIVYFNIKTYISIDHIVYALCMAIAISVIY